MFCTGGGAFVQVHSWSNRARLLYTAPWFGLAPFPIVSKSVGDIDSIMSQKQLMSWVTYWKMFECDVSCLTDSTDRSDIGGCTNNDRAKVLNGKQTLHSSWYTYHAYSVPAGTSPVGSSTRPFYRPRSTLQVIWSNTDDCQTDRDLYGNHSALWLT